MSPNQMLLFGLTGSIARGNIGEILAKILAANLDDLIQRLLLMHGCLLRYLSMCLGSGNFSVIRLTGSDNPQAVSSDNKRKVRLGWTINLRLMLIFDDKCRKRSTNLIDVRHNEADLLELLI